MLWHQDIFSIISALDLFYFEKKIQSNTIKLNSTLETTIFGSELPTYIIF